VQALQKLKENYRRMLELIRSHINDHYGSKRGLLKHFSFAAHGLLGRFRRYKKIDWSRVDRIIFICQGNICRSPLAEYVARAEGANTESFGLDCGDQYPADPRAIRFGSTLGLDLEAHRSRNIAVYQPLPGDLLIVMEPMHLPGTIASSRDIAQVTLAGLWLRTPRPYIHDPYSSGDTFFARCETFVSEAARRIAQNARAAGL
jgi:protein-tyrosine phosphatase